MSAQAWGNLWALVGSALIATGLYRGLVKPLIAALWPTREGVARWLRGRAGSLDGAFTMTISLSDAPGMTEEDFKVALVEEMPRILWRMEAAAEAREELVRITSKSEAA